MNRLKIEKKKSEIIEGIQNNLLNGEQHLDKFLKRFTPSEKFVILIDIVGFSKCDSRTQMGKILFFQFFLRTYIFSSCHRFRGKIKVKSFIPTGDGCYIVAEKCDEKTAVQFLREMIFGFNKIQEKLEHKTALRASALFGEVLLFRDIAGHKNYIGEGMNEASRILSGGQKALEEQFLAENPDKKGSGEEKKFSRNSLYFGDSLRKEVLAAGGKAGKVYEFADVADKHGKKRNITVLQNITGIWLK